MESEAHASGFSSRPGYGWLVWPGLALAFSPVLLDLAEHLIAHPWARSALIFPWLVTRAIRANEAGSQSRRLIWGCVVLGLLIELIAASGGMLRLGRVGLVVAAFGILCGGGWARPSVALLLVWSVPLPSALLRIASPQLETTWAGVAATLLPGVELDATTSGPMLIAADQALRLSALDGGLGLGFGLAGLGWFVAVMARHPSSGRALAYTVGGAVAMVPAQVILLAIAGLALAAGFEASRVRWALDQAGWILVCALGIAFAVRLGPAQVPARRDANRC